MKNGVVYIAGDSGSGVQLLGQLLAHINSYYTPNIITMAEFPPEIRAPMGSREGVSIYKLFVGEKDNILKQSKCNILGLLSTAGLDLVKKHLIDEGYLILDSNQFSDKKKYKNFTEVEIEDFEEKKRQSSVISIPITDISYGITGKRGLFGRNIVLLGYILWLYSLNPKYIENALIKMRVSQETIDTNIKLLRAGFNYGEVIEETAIPNRKIFIHNEVDVKDRKLVSGNDAIVYGILTASAVNNIPILYASYPITPASTLFKKLLTLKAYMYGELYQAEDEIAALGVAIGASIGHSFGVTATSGPGLSLCTEMLGFAIAIEIPLLFVNVQRVGPSTGIPTKSEQTDLNHVLFGGHGETPIVIFAPYDTNSSFLMTCQAIFISIKYMTPVILLSDLLLSNSLSYWNPNNFDEVKEMKIEESFQGNSIYERDENGARYWPKLEATEKIHSIGGLEKDKEGKPSHNLANHANMVEERKNKIKKASRFFKQFILINSKKSRRDYLIIGWGSSYSAIRSCISSLDKEHGVFVDHLHILIPSYLELNDEVLNSYKAYKKRFVIEANTGQLAFVLRSLFLQKVESISILEEYMTGDLLKNKLLNYL